MFWRTLASRQTTAQLKTSKQNGCATAESRTKCRLVRPTQSFGAKNAKTTLTMQNSQNTTTKCCWFFSVNLLRFCCGHFDTSHLERAKGIRLPLLEFKTIQKMLADYIQCKNHNRGQLAVNVGVLTHLDGVNDATKAGKTWLKGADLSSGSSCEF